MSYLETLRRGGWLADPGDRVRVVPSHAETCPSRSGGPCRCVPRLVLAVAMSEVQPGTVEAIENAS